MLGHIQGLPIEMEEAALVEGASRWGVFWRVVLPLIKPGLAITAMFTFIFSWNEYLFAFQLAGNEVSTVTVYIPRLRNAVAVLYGEVAAASLLSIIPAIIFAWVLQRYLVRGLATGGGKGSMSAKTFGRLMVAPAVIILSVVGIVPFFYAIYLALYRSPPNPALPATFYGAGNLVDLVQDDQFIQSVINTLVLLVVSVFFMLLLGFILALALRQITRFRGPIISLILIPSALAPVVVGVDWWMMFSTRFGPINGILQQWFGMDPVDWTVSMPAAFVTITVATIWQWTPFVAVILLGGLLSLPTSVDEAAQIDGASSWQSLWYITLPLMRPYFLVAGLLMIIEVLRIYEVPWFITQGGPGNDTVVAGIYLYKLAFNFVDIGRASMMSLILVVFLVIISTLYVRWLSHKDDRDVKQLV